MTNISVVHATAGLHPRSGGTSRVVVDLVDALARQEGFRIALVTQSRSGDDCLPNASASVERVVAESGSGTALKFGLPFREALKRLVRKTRPALIHNHGLWLPVNHWAAKAARQYQIPLVAQPHGMLEPWSLAHRAWKKRIAMTLFQRRDLQTARLMIASSPVECGNLRKLGFRQPIAMIPNGVKLVALDADAERPEVPVSRNRTVLFLSRIHPVKGLLNLAHAWARVSPTGWTLRIAGPDEGGHLAEVMAAVQKLGLQHSVEYVGEADTRRKSVLYREADLFVLPTFTENFGVVVAEALAHGLPVITTRGAPWADLIAYRCGWWVDIGVEPLEHALRKAMALNDDERRAMGARGREYVRRYDWEVIALQSAAVYRWMLGVGEKPECVITD
jgi:glycosyltransferase involved in cell wall biosynthesis